MNNDTHDQLIQAFQEYFKHQDYFERTTNDMAGIKARHFLTDIRNLATIRRDEIQKKRKEAKKLRNGRVGRPPKIHNE
jgi:hypothetical protein